MWRRYLRFVIGNFRSRFVGASRHPHAGGLDGQGVDDCGGSAISPTPDLLDVTAPGLGSLPDGIGVTINAPVNEFPVAAKQNSLFRSEPGNVCKILELQHKWTQVTSRKHRFGRKLQKFPVIFPVLREFRKIALIFARWLLAPALRASPCFLCVKRR